MTIIASIENCATKGRSLSAPAEARRAFRAEASAQAAEAAGALAQQQDAGRGFLVRVGLDSLRLI